MGKYIGYSCFIFHCDVVRSHQYLKLMTVVRWEELFSCDVKTPYK